MNDFLENWRAIWRRFQANGDIAPVTELSGCILKNLLTSKSDKSDNSRINLTDSADTIAQKIRKAKTLCQH